MSGKICMYKEIEESYKKLGSSSFYDHMLLGTTFTGRIVVKTVWGFNKEDNEKWLDDVFKDIPSDFKGKLLEVPVGTGVLSLPIFKDLDKASITCLDYSNEMMNQAREKADLLNINNITFIQGDVGHLPFED